MSGRFAGKRIGVLMGGPSAERDVSLNSGRGVHAALASRGHDAVAIDWRNEDDLAALLRGAEIEVVWNALHGTFGEDGGVQGLLTCLGIPYTGSGILASALCFDKLASKRVLASEGLRTPAWSVVTNDAAVALPEQLSLPVVVKPALEGSSVGVTIVRDEDQLQPAVELAREFHGATLIEAYIDGAEVNVGILDGRVLGSVEIQPAVSFYDYEAKYLRDDTQYFVPPRLPSAVIREGEELALRCHQLLGCSGHSRIDLMIASDSGDAFFIEANTLPGMTSHSLLPKIAAGAGMDYAALCEAILETAHS